MDVKDQIIEEQRQLIEELQGLVEQLRREIEELKLKLAKATKDSSTSSKPPAKKKTCGRPKKRKKGAQQGHQRKLREPLPPERVNKTIECEIDDREAQRLGLTPTGDFEIIQHIELPETPVHVTEYRLAVYQDVEGRLYLPDCPELKGPIFGPRLLATSNRQTITANNKFATASSTAASPKALVAKPASVTMNGAGARCIEHGDRSPSTDQ